MQFKKCLFVLPAVLAFTLAGCGNASGGKEVAVEDDKTVVSGALNAMKTGGIKTPLATVYGEKSTSSVSVDIAATNFSVLSGVKASGTSTAAAYVAVKDDGTYEAYADSTSSGSVSLVSTYSMDSLSYTTTLGYSAEVAAKAEVTDKTYGLTTVTTTKDVSGVAGTSVISSESKTSESSYAFANLKMADYFGMINIDSLSGVTLPAISQLTDEEIKEVEDYLFNTNNYFDVNVTQNDKTNYYTINVAAKASFFTEIAAEVNAFLKSDASTETEDGAMSFIEGIKETLAGATLTFGANAAISGKLVVTADYFPVDLEGSFNLNGTTLTGVKYGSSNTEAAFTINTLTGTTTNTVVLGEKVDVSTLTADEKATILAKGTDMTDSIKNGTDKII